VDAKLYVIFPGNPANVMNIKLFLDGIRCPLTYDDAIQAFVATGIPPRDFFGLSVFEFELAAHYDEKDPSDVRDLGLPFCAFEAVSRRDGPANG
jgi:hypothetical protein